jgi:hypothetical protein
MMRFYNHSHRFYGGGDLHARSMYVCFLDQAGTIRCHQNRADDPEAFLQASAPYRDGLVVAAVFARIFDGSWVIPRSRLSRG